MQTFITDLDMTKNAKNLDNKRLGKQRVEALQIASCLLVKESRWKNHPAVKMWRDNEGYLIEEYIPAIFKEWESRGFKNEKCKDWYKKLQQYLYNKEIFNVSKPWWLDSFFIETHRSNLIRKDKDFYKQKFPNTKEELSYEWPHNILIKIVNALNKNKLNFKDSKVLKIRKEE